LSKEYGPQRWLGGWAFSLFLRQRCLRPPRDGALSFFQLLLGDQEQLLACSTAVIRQKRIVANHQAFAWKFIRPAD
jgi:hypothetical protein